MAAHGLGSGPTSETEGQWSLGHSPWDPATVHWSKEPEGWLGPGHLAPSVTAGQGLGTWSGDLALRASLPEICLFSGPGHWQKDPNWLLDECSQAG